MTNKLLRIIQSALFSVILFCSTQVGGETRNIVPRGPSEGSIGTSAKPWGDGWFDDLHVGGNSIFSNLEGTNGVAITPTETGAAVGLDTNALTELPKFLKWDGEKIVWDDKFDIPEGMDVPAYLASLNVPNFMQQQSVKVPGVVASIYENNPGEELVSEVNFGTRELGRFDLEEITGPTQFIVTETNGYYGKFNSSVEYTKVRPGVCIVINGQYYPIADITDGDGWGQGNGSVKLSLPLVPGETYDVEGYSGISSGEGYSRLSYAFDPDGAAEQFRAEPSTFYVTGWCCTPDFQIQYLATWGYIYKSIDAGQHWFPVRRLPHWWYSNNQMYFFTMDCSPDGNTVIGIQGYGRAGLYMHDTAEGIAYILKTTNSFKDISSISKLGIGVGNSSDIYCAGSNKWGSVTWCIPVHYDYANAGAIVSTNNGLDWIDVPCIPGNRRINSVACDPNLTTFVWRVDSNTKVVNVGIIDDFESSITFSSTTSYTISRDLQPTKFRFARAGEYGEFVDTNKIYFVENNWNSVRFDDGYYIYIIDRANDNRFDVYSPFGSRILQLLPLANGEISIACNPGSTYTAKFTIDESNRVIQNPRYCFRSILTGSGFWRTDSWNINNNCVYDSLKINSTRPNVWYISTQPYYRRVFVSQDYGTSWKEILSRGDVGNYCYDFACAGLDDEFIYAWPIEYGNYRNMKYNDLRNKSLVKANNDYTHVEFVDGNPFKFYELSWPVSNKLYAIVELGFQVYTYGNRRLAVSEDKGKTWYFPGGPNHAYAAGIYAQSYTDSEGDSVTNVIVSQASYARKKRPWLWNSKTDKWTSLELNDMAYDDYADNNARYFRTYPAKIYDGGKAWAGVYGFGTWNASRFFRTTNALSYSIRTDKAYSITTSSGDASKYCNVSIVDDPDTGKEIWFYGFPQYTRQYGGIGYFKPDESNIFTILENSPTGRCETIEAVSKDVIWACISTNAASRNNVWKTTDSGETWMNTTAMKPGLPAESATGSAYFGTVFGIWPVDENQCYISQGNKFYETLDGGETWTYKGQAPYSVTCYKITGDHANRANTNMIWYCCESDSDTTVPRIFYTTNQFETSEPFAWIDKKCNPWNTDSRYTYMNGLYSPSWDPETIYSGMYESWPMVSHDGGKTWNYIPDPDADPDEDPTWYNQFSKLTTAEPNYGWQVTGHGDTIIYTKLYQPYYGSGYSVSGCKAEVFISREGELAGKPRRFQKLELPDDYVYGVCPLAKNGTVYAGNEIILNQGESFCYYNAGPDTQKLVGNNQTMITKTNGIDSARWAQLEEVAVDSLYSKSTKSAVTVLFSFDQGNSYKKYDKLAQAWETVVYKDQDTGTWYFRTERNPGGQDQYGTVLAQSPQASISAAMAYKFNRFSDEEISQVTDLEWNYPGAFDSETTSNMMFSVTFIPAEEYNGKAEVPAIYDVSFKTVMKSDLYTKKDNNYLVTQQEGETSSTVTKTNSAVANSVIYYLRNIP